MKNRAHDLVAYSFRKEETLLFDTNIWLYLFPAPSNPSPAFAPKYSDAFKRIRLAGSPVALDTLILSEYVNRYCQIEWIALHRNRFVNFKDFRQSNAFSSVGQGAATLVRNILKLSSRCDHPLSTLNIEQVLADFESGRCDLNDGLLIETCRLNGWKLVTHDGDCSSGGIDVITTNSKLLAACAL